MVMGENRKPQARRPLKQNGSAIRDFRRNLRRSASARPKTRTRRDERHAGSGGTIPLPPSATGSPRLSAPATRWNASSLNPRDPPPSGRRQRRSNSTRQRPRATAGSTRWPPDTRHGPHLRRRNSTSLASVPAVSALDVCQRDQVRLARAGQSLAERAPTRTVQGSAISYAAGWNCRSGRSRRRFFRRSSSSLSPSASCRTGNAESAYLIMMTATTPFADAA